MYNARSWNDQSMRAHLFCPMPTHTAISICQRSFAGFSRNLMYIFEHEHVYRTFEKAFFLSKYNGILSLLFLVLFSWNNCFKNKALWCQPGRIVKSGLVGSGSQHNRELFMRGMRIPFCPVFSNKKWRAIINFYVYVIRAGAETSKTCKHFEVRSA